METIIWIAITVVCFVAVWLSGPYHQRLIDKAHEPDEVPPRASMNGG